MVNIQNTCDVHLLLLYLKLHRHSHLLELSSLVFLLIHQQCWFHCIRHIQRHHQRHHPHYCRHHQQHLHHRLHRHNLRLRLNGAAILKQENS